MKSLFLAASLAVCLASCNSSGHGCTNSNKNRYESQDSDWKVTSRVRSALREDSSLSASARNVNVETTDGVVTLTGNVDSRKEFYEIERKVKSVDGVRRVDNQLIVNP